MPSKIDWRYQTGGKNSQIEEGQTTQWPKEKGQTTSTEYYAKNCFIGLKSGSKSMNQN
jgi:hypothetical protein